MQSTIDNNTDAHSFQHSLSNLELPNYNFSDAQYPLSPETMLDIIIARRIPPGILRKIESRIYTPLRDLVRPRQIKSRRRAGPPRPQNMYIIYRKDLQNKINQVKGRDVGSQLQFVSKIASRGWENIDPETRLLYNYIAECAKDYHSYVFPGYSYKPKKKSMHVFSISMNESTDDTLSPSTLYETQPNVTSINYTAAHNNIDSYSSSPLFVFNNPTAAHNNIDSYSSSPLFTSLSSPVFNNPALIDQRNRDDIYNWTVGRPLLDYGVTAINPSCRNLPPLCQTTIRSHVDRGHLSSVDRQVRL